MCKRLFNFIEFMYIILRCGIDVYFRNSSELFIALYVWKVAPPRALLDIGIVESQSEEWFNDSGRARFCILVLFLRYFTFLVQA